MLSAQGVTAHFKKIHESALQVGCELHRIYLESISFISYALEHEVFPRGDYKHLVQYLAFAMNKKSKNLTTSRSTSQEPALILDLWHMQFIW